ncbi:uncharacterized protein LOC130159716 [Falco biarmicus]|uniref:uncharacterized protein LOC130159716 n=1 Tax=Falco biarmicus TaxID=345155 RepID=UPI0024BC6A1A|nr:uncharacterized protein LOC130159716 [Falco biarmicus]XP_056217587.1 uncharacterized protein LOC130159716 [Falco biarmicus]
MASETKGEARMGAEQIGNFLPVPLPHAQTLLGACGERDCLAPVVPPKCLFPWQGLTPQTALSPKLCILPEPCGESQNPESQIPKHQNPISILLLMWSCESRTPPFLPASVCSSVKRGPQLVQGGEGSCHLLCPPPGVFSCCLCSFLISSQQRRSCCRTDPSSLLIINFYCSSHRKHVCRWPGVAVGAVTWPPILLSSQLLRSVKGFRLSLRRIEQREALKDVTPGYTSLGRDLHQLCKRLHAGFEAQRRCRARGSRPCTGWWLLPTPGSSSHVWGSVGSNPLPAASPLSCVLLRRKIFGVVVFKHKSRTSWGNILLKGCLQTGWEAFALRDAAMGK